MPDDSWDDPEDEFDDAGTSEDFEPWSPATDYDDHLPATDNEPTAPLTLTVTVTNGTPVDALFTAGDTEVVTGVLQKDFPTVQSVALVLTIAVIFINLVVDLACTALDPRTR